MEFDNDVVSTEVIKSRIYEVRGRRIMIDSDLAELYGVETKNLKRAVRMNIERFPNDFMFELTKEEYDFLRCNFFTIKNNNKNSRPEGAKPHPTLGYAHCSHNTSSLALKGQKQLTSGSARCINRYK